MKKRVRVYQMGGVQAMQNVGNVNSGPSEDELVSAAMKMIGEDQATPDEVLNAFVQNGIQPDKANQVVSSVVEYINEQAELGNAQLTDSDNRAALEDEEMARQQDAAAAAEEEARQDQMYQDMYADEGTTDYSDDEQVASDIIMKYGGLPNKKTFVRNVFALAKKQMGGNPDSNKPLDDKSFGQKESGLDAFVRSAQNSANNALMKKDAEAMYSALQPYFQDGGDTESGIMDFDPYHNLAHYSDTFEHAMPTDETDIVQAQFGGMSPGQARRMQRRVNRMVGQIPAAMYDARQTMFPQGINVMTLPMMGPQAYYMPPSGSYQGGPRLANIDVRKTGIFGRPKEYTITFAQEAYNNPQLRQDIIKQEQNNVVTDQKETAEEQKAAETNTATTENKEVVKEAEKSDSTGGAGTDGTKKTDGKKPDTGKTVDDEVSYNTNRFGKPDYSAFQYATADQVKNNKITYNVYTNNQGKVDGSKDFIDPNKSYSYNPSTKQWYQGTSKNPITDPTRIANLNRWRSKGLLIEDYTNEVTPKNKPYNSAVENKKRAAHAQHLMSIPQAAQADDELIQQLAFMGAGSLASRVPGASQITLKPWSNPKGYLPGAKGLPSPKGGFSAPNAWGTGPKGLPWSGYNVRYMQEGGMTDYESGLYRFIYGGGEDFSIPQVGGKITDDPYFQDGGLFEYQDKGEVTPAGRTVTEEEYKFLQEQMAADKARKEKEAGNKKLYDDLKAKGINVGDYREGIDYSKVNNNTTTTTQQQQQQYPQAGGYDYYNPYVGAMYPPVFGGRRFGPPSGFGYAGSWVQQQGLPVDPRTGKVIGQMPTDLPLTKIDVTKSSLFGKRPKEFTMYYGNYGQLEGQGKPGETKPGATTTKGEGSNRPNTRQTSINPETGLPNPKQRPLADLLLRSKVPFLQKAGAKMYPWEDIPDTENKKEVFGDLSKLKKSNFQFNKSTTGDYIDVINQQKGPMEGAQFPMAYGGYLPEAQMGLYTTNPNMVGYSDIDLLNSQTAPEVTGAESAMGNWWEPMPGSNMPTIQDTGVQQPEEILTDPNQPNRATIKREYDPRGAAVKYKVKNMYNVDFEKGVNQFNRGVNQALAMFGERGARKRMADMQNNLTADNLYGSTGIQDRGTYETNSGLFRPDEMGFKGVVRDGGYMQEGGDFYDENDITWMSEDQIRQFLAEGGELEFIQE